MPIKTTMRYHFILVRMSTINKSTNKCWRGYEEKGTLVHCRWECRLVPPLWKTVQSFLKKKKKELPYDPGMPLLGLYPKNPELPIQKNLCTPTFIPVLFTIAKCWKLPKCLSVDEWIFKKKTKKPPNYGIFTQWNITQQKERRNSYLFPQHGWKWRIFC